MNLEDRHQILEGEMMAAKDAIWRLTTRVFHLEKEVKDLKLVLKYTTKGFKPRAAKAAEMARFQKSKKSTGKESAVKRDGLGTQLNQEMPQQEQGTFIKAEPMSDHISSTDEGWGNEHLGQSSVHVSTGVGKPVHHFDPQKHHYSDDSDSYSSDADEKVSIKKYQKNSLTVKVNRSLAGSVEGRKGKGRRPKSPTWDYFVVENSKYRNKDTLAICKICNKNFAWPKIERLRKHVISCKGKSPPAAPLHVQTEPSICDIVDNSSVTLDPDEQVETTSIEQIETNT